jgi:hypothetical protein
MIKLRRTSRINGKRIARVHRAKGSISTRFDEIELEELRAFAAPTAATSPTLNNDSGIARIGDLNYQWECATGCQDTAILNKIRGYFTLGKRTVACNYESNRPTKSL